MLNVFDVDCLWISGSQEQTVSPLWWSAIQCFQWVLFEYLNVLIIIFKREFMSWNYNVHFSLKWSMHVNVLCVLLLKNNCNVLNFLFQLNEIGNSICREKTSENIWNDENSSKPHIWSARLNALLWLVYVVLICLSKLINCFFPMQGKS